MYQIKNRIYLNFDKTQKTAICNYIRAFVKQKVAANNDDIINLLNKFLENEKYYLELNASRFQYLADIIDDKIFIQDTKDYITECVKYYKYKEAQRPIIEAQKEFEKKKRKFLHEVKMSKEEPTKKQIYYYDKLCKKYNIDKQNVKELSKLDIKNEIERILNEYSNNY